MFNESSEKLKIFEVLQALNVDIVEAGFAIASEGDFEAIKEISKIAKNTKVCSLARANEQDIDKAHEALQSASIIEFILLLQLVIYI